MTDSVNVWKSDTADPILNLSFEECVLDNAATRLPCLVLYQNDNAVVIGKNQNPWVECDPERLQSMGIPVLRRVSGGGTVFHGPGNLNVGFIVPRHGFERVRQLRVLADAIRSPHISPEITERGDILCEGYKVSGNAMCYRRDRVLHHMTLLCTADLETLRESLRPADDSIESRAIASHRMSVANLSWFDANLSPEIIERRIVSTFNKVYSVGDTGSIDDIDPACVTERKERHKSWGWRFGRTPRFTARAADGRCLSVREGVVEAIITEDGSSRSLSTPVRFKPGLVVTDEQV